MGKKITQTMRWILGVLLVVAGLSTTWAWGEVARLAGPGPTPVEAPPVAVYAAWQADTAEQMNLFRSTDKGESWKPLALPGDARPVAWADNGRQHVAVALDDSSLVFSKDRGENWIVVETDLDISSLIWSDRDCLYLGTDGFGVYHLTTDEAVGAISMMQNVSAPDRIVSLSLFDGRLFAATPNAVMYTDDVTPTAGQVSWTVSTPLPDLALVTSIAATDRQTVYAGTAATGIYRSTDAGQTWQPANNGLGSAAGLMVGVTALGSDPLESGVLYAAVNHMVGSTHVHASAAGLFVTVDSGTWWQPLAGPSFPEARHASGLVLIPDRPLYVQAVTAKGLQGYVPDVMRILAALETDDPVMRASAARQLGMARPMGVWNRLLGALDDPDLSVSLAAATALGRINDPASIPGLLISVNHPSGQVRLGSARALGMMQVEAAVEPLRVMLLQGEGLEASTAAEALGRIGGQAAIEALLVALADSKPTGRWHLAMAALERMGEPAVAPLVTMLDSQDAHARSNAAQALGWIGSSSATEALVHILKQDGHGEVRAQAAWALGEIGDPAGRRALERAQMRDSVIEVQAAAEWALSRVPLQTGTDTSWAAHWAPRLNQLQPVRWLVLALSLASGAWLMMGTRSWAAAPLRLRPRSPKAER